MIQYNDPKKNATPNKYSVIKKPKGSNDYTQEPMINGDGKLYIPGNYAAKQ